MNVSDILFQFTPLREGRQFQPHKLMVASNFNSRPSARGDASNLRDTLTAIYFNSRPSARGDIVYTMTHILTIKFQFTPLREGRHTRAVLPVRKYCYFNSRPSARGDVYGYNDLQNPSISIHAPPRGATTYIIHHLG